MKRSPFFVVVGAISLLVAAHSRADDISVSVQIVPATVAVGENAQLTVTVSGKFRRSAAPVLPQLSDLYVYEAGTSQSMQFINGQMSSSLAYTYVVTPQKEGSYTIAPIQLTIGDKQYTANPVTLEVTAAASAISPQPSPPLSGSTPDPGAKPAAPDDNQSIFVAAEASADTVYVNQQVTWTLGYYADGRVNLLRSPNYTPPVAEGFWVEDLPPQNKYYATIHGRQYLVNEIKRAYFPTAPGVFTVGEARVDVVVDDFSSRGLVDDFFSRGFSGGFGKQHTLHTEAKKVFALALPEKGKPKDFSGIVAGNLRVTMSADKQVVRVGEPVGVKVTVDGIGNMKTIAAPTFPSDPRYKTYESGSSSESFKRDYVVSGRKTYDFVVVPQEEGYLSLVAIQLNYFDPSRRAYDTARSLPVPIEVKPGAEEDGRRVVYAGGGDNFRVINRDIRHIRTAPLALVSSSPRVPMAVFGFAHAIPLLAVIGSVFIERRRSRYAGNAGLARASRAFKDASRGVQRASALAQRDDGARAMTTLAAAFGGYFADHMNVPTAGLTRESTDAFLRERGADDSVCKDVAGVFDACDAARYAMGATGKETALEMAQTAARLLRVIEKSFK